ncbi:Uncharacterized protein BM_BM1337 [Brugia malayi]|uniref:Bm1337 n=1 Tax=Brugia malayi TaxID=6279 RepID=A0A0K0IXM0_BRUMA|nr:Uncharacterized protein BM_BM1337 [Brugia malayi]CDP96157.1 Bm1337 [Brugia malayi]VIO98567.1 Uncharacterized protein BM_BM1337 [Brugia malayi]
MNYEGFRLRVNVTMRIITIGMNLSDLRENYKLDIKSLHY